MGNLRIGWCDNHCIQKMSRGIIVRGTLKSFIPIFGEREKVPKCFSIFIICFGTIGIELGTIRRKLGNDLVVFCGNNSDLFGISK
jgi:hypothetical protein